MRGGLATLQSFASYRHGGQDGIITVRRYLDGWSVGHANQGAPEGSFVPVAEEDVISV